MLARVHACMTCLNVYLLLTFVNIGIYLYEEDWQSAEARRHSFGLKALKLTYLLILQLIHYPTYFGLPSFDLSQPDMMMILISIFCSIYTHDLNFKNATCGGYKNFI